MDWFFCCVHLGEMDYSIVASQDSSAQTRWMMCTRFHCFGPEFQLPWLIASAMCLRDQPPTKASGPEPQTDFPWQRHFHTCPCGLLPEGKTHSVWPSMRKDVGSLCWTSLDSVNAYLFPLAFALYLPGSVLAVTCYWLMTLSSESLKLRTRLWDFSHRNRIDHCYHRQLGERFKSRNIACMTKAQQISHWWWECRAWDGDEVRDWWAGASEWGLDHIGCGGHRATGSCRKSWVEEWQNLTCKRNHQGYCLESGG